MTKENTMKDPGEETSPKKGFTLLEIIVTLLLIGILGAISGIGMTQATRAYLFVQEAANLTHDTQLTLNRMSRAIINLQEIDTSATYTNADKLTITGFRDGDDVRETYYLEDTTLKMDTEINGGPSVTNILGENISDFALLYTGSNSSGSTYDWLTSRTPSELAKIQITLICSSFSGANVSFTTQVIPRNIYRPLSVVDFDDQGLSGMQNVSCFISEASGDLMNLNDMNSILIETGFRYLLFLTHDPVGRTIAGAVWIIGSIMLFIRLKRLFQNRFFPHRQTGAALLGIVVTMVIIGILGASVVSLISTSERGAGASIFNQRAHYLAESAYRYLALSYMATDGDTASLTALNASPTFTIRDGSGALADSFTVTSTSFWFRTKNGGNDASLEVVPAVRYPEAYENLVESPGYVLIERTTSRSLVPYTVSYPGALDTQTITLNLTSGAQTVTPGLNVFPASPISGSLTLNEGDTLTLPVSIASFPKKNAVFRLVRTMGTATIEDDVIYYLKYDTADVAARQLMNIRNVISDAGNIPRSGVSLTAADYVCLDQNILITATGTAGAGEFLSSRNLYYYQPLFQVNMAITHMRENRFNDLGSVLTGAANGELGQHAIAAVNAQGIEGGGADNALKVSKTDIKTSASAIQAAHFGKGVQESVVEIKPSFGKFSDVWTQEAKKFSYDLQVKVCFPKEKDKQTNNPLATYMPGLLFRVRPLPEDTTLREYYGLSIVRSIFTKGCAPTDPDADDIPDQGLFDDHATNDAIDPAAAAKVCISDYTAPPQWNDTPPMSGVPYLMVWQQALDIVEYDGGVWRRDTSGQSLALDWLTYVPMCTVSAPTTVYYYRSYSGQKGVVTNYYTNAYSDWWVPDPHPIFNSMPYCDTYGFWVFFVYFPTDYYKEKKYEYCTNVNECNSSCSNLVKYWTCQENRFNCSDCETYITLPEGWYETRLPATDPRRGNPYFEKTFTAYKLSDTYNIFEKDTVNGKTILGTAANYDANFLVRNAATINYGANYAGDPVENTAYIFPNQSVEFQKNHNYRLYFKPWVTIMARIVEMNENFFDENDVGCSSTNSTKEKVNLIQAWFANPSDYPRGGAIQWPTNCANCFTQAIWPDNAYNSRMDEIQKGSGWGAINIEKRVCERGDDEYTSDSQKRSSSLFSSQLTTPDTYDDNPPSEVGLHTFGVDGSAAAEADRETMYFDDLAIVIYEYAEKSGLLPGFQFE